MIRPDGPAGSGSGASIVNGPSAPKRYRAGTHRVRSPRETLDLFEPRIHEFGITRLADVTGLDVIGLPVYMAVRPNSRAISVSQGKGIDRHAAKASALMESIEGWHAERVEGRLRYESYAALRRSSRVVDVAKLGFRRSATFEWNSPRLWIEGLDLLEGSLTWVPFECVMTNFVRPLRVATTFRAGSSGLAAGNHVLEATVHALCELIERDAGALWQAAGGPTQKERQLDLATIRDPRNRMVLERLRAADVEVAVWDTTADTEVPSFACQIFDRHDRARWTLRGVFEGQGCHLSAEVGLLRALTEAIQSRLTSIAGSRDDMFEYQAMANPDDLRLLWSAVNDPPGARAFPGGRDLSAETFEEDRDRLLAALRRIGIENAVLFDLTRPEVGIPVVKVVVPGLEDDPQGSDYMPGDRANAAAATARSEAER